jgi:2-polyprenyl-3-methyl-5-hydroxy-6-metoxy-1,4-benzoquinol methylase
MVKEKLFEYTLELLKKSIYTNTIPQKLSILRYNRSFGEQICQIVFKICDSNIDKYDIAVKGFIDFSQEFLILQMELNKTGSYKFSTLEETKRLILDDPNIMTNRYMHGLLLSQALWINHYDLFNFFISEFCKDNKLLGSVLEVPVGSGIFSCEFLKMNSKWDLIAFDLSKSSVKYAKSLFLNSSLDTSLILEGNVFDISEDKKFDKIICGELLEHLENPKELLRKLKTMINAEGKIFLTTAIWAAAIDHIYLFTNIYEVREMLEEFFIIEKELALPVFQNKSIEDFKTPINYACILSKK